MNLAEHIIATSILGIAAPALVRITADKFVTPAAGANLTLYVDASTGVRTITLPLASKSKNMSITVKKVDTSLHAVNVVRSGTDGIEGTVSRSLTTQYASATYRADSSNSFWGVH